MKKLAALALVPALAVSNAALAAAPDFTDLTESVDTSTIIPALMAVGGVLIGVAVAMMGIRKVLRMVR